MESDDYYIKLYFGVPVKVQLSDSNLPQKVAAFIKDEKKLQEALECSQSDNLEFGHPRCLCNNEVKYSEGQNTTKFIS